MTISKTGSVPGEQVPAVVRLAFDPATAEPEVRKVFADPMAAQIWCLVKRCHLTSQHFNADCLWLASAIRTKPPANAEELRRLAVRAESFEGIAMEFWAALLPVVRGEKTVAIEMTPA